MAYDEESFLQGLIAGASIKYLEQYIFKFKFTYNRTQGSNEAYIYNITAKGMIVDWGDGSRSTISNYSEETLSHEYQTYGTFTVTMRGVFSGFNFGNYSGAFSPTFKLSEVLTPIPETVILPNGFLGNCRLLNSINADIFSKCKLADMSGVGLFLNCESIHTIPDNIFYRFANVKYFRGCFQNCTNLSNIPMNLFSNCKSAEIYNDAFSGCSNLEEIPETLFSGCPNAKEFYGTFRRCRNLESIPAGIFNNCHKAYDFGQCFADCTGISVIPDGMFDNCTPINFESTFSGCTGLTHLPALWDKFPNTAHTWCFRDCTAADNYADCPDDWK